MSYTDTERIIFDKIGGWLILPAFLHPLVGIVGNIRASYEAFKLYTEALPLNSQIFIFAIGVGGIMFVVAWITSAYLAATLNPSFPKFYIGLVVTGLASSILILTVTTNVFSYNPTPQDYGDLTKEILAALIWVPYMLVSKRVKATFYGIPMPEKIRHKNMSSPLNQAAADRVIFSVPADQERKLKIELNMAQRAGMVLYWAGTGTAVLLVALGIFGAVNAPDKFVVVLCFGAAVISWLIGRAIKYILVGR